MKLIVYLMLIFLLVSLSFWNSVQLAWIWFSLQVGITIAARKYDFNSAAPFQTSNIMNLQPVVKHSVPLCSEAKDLVETGKIQLAEVWVVLCSIVEILT